VKERKVLEKSGAFSVFSVHSTGAVLYWIYILVYLNCLEREAGS